MARSVSEWIGRTDDSKASARVRDRVFERDGHTCHICRLAIKVGETWDLDHVIALINGGENRETNLAPAHSHCHLGKTASDVAIKAKVAKIRQRHTGAKRPAGKMQSAGFPKTEKPDRPVRQALPPRPLFWQPSKNPEVHDVSD